MTLAVGSEFGDGGHGPVEAAEVIRIAIAEPILNHPEALSAARYAAIGVGEVGRVIERPNGILLGLGIASLCVVEGVHGRPPGGIAAQARRRTAEVAPPGSRALFVDTRRAVEGP